jgi:hypothetical protein
MTLLDKFRTQSRDKHPDPAVRLAYVEEIPLGERGAIAAVAREDEDPRVRKAAVSKLMDPAALGAIAASDADEGVRAQAAAMLRDIALDAFEGLGENDSLDAVDAIADQKLLLHVAKASPRDVVALKAVARMSTMAGGPDAHALGSIARHAGSEAARRDAFDLLRQRGERAEIMAVAMNGEFKDTAAAAVEWFAAERDDLERIAGMSRNKAAAKRARGILREAEERQAAADAAARAAASALALEAAAADAGSTRAAPPPAEIAAIDPPAVPLDPEAAAREEEQRRQGAEAEERARAEEQAARERAEADAGARAAAEAEAREKAEAEAARREAERREAREANERARREGLARMHNLLGRVEPLAAKPDITLKAADRALRDVRAALEDIPPLPSRADFEDVSQRLKAAQSALADKVHELKTAAEWRQWANAGVQ